MTNEQFDKLVSSLERLSAQRPVAYKLRVLLLALLGYGYLFILTGALVAAIIVVGMMAASGKHGYLALKLGLPLLLVVGLVLRALWVRLEAPAGVELTRCEVPALFGLLDALRRQLRGPRIHTVLLDGRFNAAVVQLPRMGIFGWQKNYLMLGLPLMQALSPEQFRAVLGHEYGHLAGAHSRFRGWIYRVRKTWHQLMERMQEREGWVIALFTRFFNWYAPFFSAYTFVLARANEYEADRAGADVTNTRIAADALLAVEVKGEFLERRFWPEIYRHADEEASPSVAPFSALPRHLLDASTQDTVHEVLDAALARATGSDDTHPALADRLAALGERARPPGPIGQTAAEALLGAALAALTVRLDQRWRVDVAESWGARFREVSEGRNQLSALRAKSATGAELTLQESWDMAARAEELEGEQVALPLYRAVLGRVPDDPAPLFALGRLLLARDDAEGITLMEKAAQIDPQRTTDACAALYRYYRRVGDEACAEQCRARALKHEEEEEAAAAERARLGAADELLPHGLDQTALGALREQLARYPRIARAWIARKAVKHLPDKPIYVLGFAHPWWYYSFSNSKSLVEALVREVSFPGETFVIPVNGHDVRDWTQIGKRMKKLPGALVYRR